MANLSNDKGFQAYQKMVSRFDNRVKEGTSLFIQVSNSLASFRYFVAKYCLPFLAQQKRGTKNVINDFYTDYICKRPYNANVYKYTDYGIRKEEYKPIARSFNRPPIVDKWYQYKSFTRIVDYVKGKGYDRLVKVK